MTETAEIYGGIRAKVAEVRAALDRTYDTYRMLTKRLHELQDECRHEEGFAPSKKYPGLEACVICGKARKGKSR